MVFAGVRISLILFQFTCTPPLADESWEAPGPGLRICGQSQDASTSHLETGDQHHLLTENFITSRATAQTQAVMKAVRKCVPVPVILLFVNILFIRNYSEKEKGDNKQAYC